MANDVDRVYLLFGDVSLHIAFKALLHQEIQLFVDTRLSTTKSVLFVHSGYVADIWKIRRHGRI